MTKARENRSSGGEKRKSVLFFFIFSGFLLLVPFVRPEVSSVLAEEGFAADIEHLAGGDPDLQTAALKELAERSDPATLPLLNALHEGSLYRWTTPEGTRVVFVQMTESADGEKKGIVVDSLTGIKVGEGDGTEEGFEMISVRSGDGRRWLSAALDRIKLFDPSGEIRKSAATQLGNGSDLSALLTISRALARERDRW